MAAPNLQRTPSIEQRDVFREHDDNVFKRKPPIVETGPLDDALLKRKRQFQKKRDLTQKSFGSTFEHIEPADMLKNRRPGITRRGGKRKRRKTRKEEKKIDADAGAGAELIKNNFIYLNFSLIYIY